MRIGIRREDKSPFERRVPLTPAHVAKLAGRGGLDFEVEPSEIRAFDVADYAEAGADPSADLSACDIVFGVKEIPIEMFRTGQAYVFFSHTIKAQEYNMPMLARMMELGCTLIDYERIADEQGRRLVFFGNFAGSAGMIDALWTLGRRLKSREMGNPFTAIKQSLHYADLADAKNALAELGDTLARDGLPEGIEPLVCGFAGYGNVSRGAQEIYDLIRPQEITPEALHELPASAKGCYKVVFREEHMFERIDDSRPFDLQEYFDHPELYRGVFGQHLPRLSMLINCIYWTTQCPRLVTRGDLQGLFGEAVPPRLEVIADISCDIEGSIECTLRATDPGHPVYVYDVAKDAVIDGVEGNGPVVLAVDILPCELPIDASEYFGDSLLPFLPSLAGVDFTKSFEQSGLPEEFKRATILYQGELTKPYTYLDEHVRKHL